MNVSSMRRVDRWVGIPMCAILTALRKLGRLFHGGPTTPVRSVMFIKLAEQGSTVLAYPALQRAVDMVGADNVYFLLFEPNRFILDAMAIIPRDNVIAIKTDTLGGTMLSTLRELRRVRSLKIDAAVDMEFFARSSAILSYLSGCRRRVGHHAFAGDGPWRGDLQTHPVGYNPHLHTSQIFDVLVETLEQPGGRLPSLDVIPTPLADLPKGTFDAAPEEVAEVEQLVCEATGLERVPPLVLINANCSDLLPLRKWQESNYVELSRRLLQEFPDHWIAFTGAPDEAPKVELLLREVNSERCISMAGRTTMRQLIVLYGLSQVLVTNDSGPAHFASLTPIDVVALFGPETPKLFHGLSARNHVVWAGTACSPCVNAYNNRVSTCSDNVCMRSITVDDVHSVVAGILDQRGGRPAQVVEIPQLAPKTAARETSPDAPALDPDTRSAGPRVDA